MSFSDSGDFRTNGPLARASIATIRTAGPHRLAFGYVIDPSLQPIPLPMAPAEARERGDAAANRVRILDAGRRLLAERGPAGFTMDAVACEAGVGKGTIFRRFGDRTGLAGALIDEDMRDLQDAFLHGPPPLGPGAPSAQRLEAFVVALLRHQAAHLDVALVAEAAPGLRASAFGAVLLHVQTLLREIDPQLDDRALAPMIVSAISPTVIREALERGAGLEALEASALALLRGLTRPR
jgi:AcrR family transcriptional regulator